MNKKLFSWKALAGLALLVAMGLTSCKQGTEVDPENPTPEKPVTPTIKGTELSGFKTVAELNKLLAEKDITDQIKADAEVTITLDCSNLKAAAGDKVVIPGKADATINLIFANALKENKGIVISDDALDVLNITFPTAEMGDFSFVMPYSKLTIDSEGVTEFGNVAFDVNENDSKSLIATISDGIYIGSFKNWDDTGARCGRIFIEDGAEVEALLLDANNNYAQNDAAGFPVRGLMTDVDEDEEYAVKNLYVTDDAWVDCKPYKKQNVAENIIIAEGKTLTLGWGQAYVDEVIGLGDNGAIVANYQSAMSTTFTNVTIDGHDNWYGESEDPVASTFVNCTLVDFNGLYLSQESASGLKFQQDDETTYTSLYYPVYADADDLAYSYEFSKCEFSSNFSLRAFAEGDNVLDKNGDPIKETLYYYNGYTDAEGNWQSGKSGLEKLSDIPEYVRKNFAEGYQWGSYLYEPKVYSFDDLELIPSFSECKYDDKAVSDKNVTNFLSWTSLYGAEGVAVATTNYVEIGDKIYKRVYAKSEGDWILVEQ